MTLSNVANVAVVGVDAGRVRVKIRPKPRAIWSPFDMIKEYVRRVDILLDSVQAYATLQVYHCGEVGEKRHFEYVVTIENHGGAGFKRIKLLHAIVPPQRVYSLNPLQGNDHLYPLRTILWEAVNGMNYNNQELEARLDASFEHLRRNLKDIIMLRRILYEGNGPLGRVNDI